MKYLNVAALFCLGVVAFSQDVHFDYDRSADFGAYKTYQWVDYRPVDVGDQLLDCDIKRAVDEQLAAKGLRRVESGGDLLVGYEAGISREKQFDATGWGGGPWGGRWGPWGGFNDVHGSTSTIDIGKLTVGLFDPSAKHLVWRGSASKTLNLSKNSDKNYRNLEKAMAKLFSSYPAGQGKN